MIVNRTDGGNQQSRRGLGRSNTFDRPGGPKPAYRGAIARRCHGRSTSQAGDVVWQCRAGRSYRKRVNTLARYRMQRPPASLPAVGQQQREHQQDSPKSQLAPFRVEPFRCCVSIAAAAAGANRHGGKTRRQGHVGVG